MELSWNLRDKTVFITGATDGIGKAAAHELARTGAQLILTSRDLRKGEVVKRELQSQTGNPRIEVLPCNLASLQSVKECAKVFKSRFSALHVLINNAGVMPQELQRSRDGFELNLAVNYLAPVLLTRLLLPLLLKSAPARIINTTSSLHTRGVIDFDDFTGTRSFDFYRSYATSKLELMLFTRSLSSELKGSGVAVIAMHPGWIRTKLALGALQRGRLLGWMRALVRMSSPTKGSETLVYLANAPEARDFSGKYLIDKKITSPSPQVSDEVLAEKLLQATDALLRDYLR